MNIPIIPLTIVSLLGFTAKAENVEKLVLETTDGYVTEFLLAEVPHITFPETSIKVETSSQQFETELYFVKNLHLEGVESTNIKAVKEKMYSIDMTTDGQIVVSGPLSNHTVRLYSISGILIASQVSNDGETATLLTAELSRGQYVVTIEGVMSFKITKQ